MRIIINKSPTQNQCYKEGEKKTFSVRTMDYDPIELNDARVYSLQNVYRLNAETTFSRKQNRIK